VIAVQIGTGQEMFLPVEYVIRAKLWRGGDYGV